MNQAPVSACLCRRIALCRISGIEPADHRRITAQPARDVLGGQSAMTKWLQFAWFELTAKIPGVTSRAVFPGSLSPEGGRQRLLTMDPTQPQWIVDSASCTDPFYEAAGFANLSPQSTTIFDRPGMLIERTVKTVFEQAKAKSGVEADPSRLLLTSTHT